MSDYQSHSMYQAPAEDHSEYHTPPVRNTAEVSSVTIRDGVVQGDTFDRARSVKSSELSPYEADDWRSTAVKQNGFPAQEITADTIVKLGGTQGRVQDFVYAGILEATKDGYVLATDAPASPEDQAAQAQSDAEQAADYAGMPQEVVQAVDAAIEPFDNPTLDHGSALAIAAVAGDMSMDSVVRSMALRSGLDPHDVQGRVQFAMSAYQSQADSFVTKNGIASDDLEDFYSFCRQHKSELTEVLQKQLHGQSMAGWRGLISKYQSGTAPSTTVLEKHGFQTRTVDKASEVRINGIWMTTQAAAKAGLI